MTNTKARFPGWRTMTRAQRHNAKMDVIFAAARAHGITALRSKRVTVTLCTPGMEPGERCPVIGRFWTVQEAEDFLATSATVDPGHLAAGHYSIDAPEEMINLKVTDTQKRRQRAHAANVFRQIDTIAEQAIRDELDLGPLAAGELCPLRAIADICLRALGEIG